MPELIKKTYFVFDSISRNNPMLKIIEFLVENKEQDFTISEISGGADVARTTLWNGILESLLNEGIITKTRDVGNAKLYKLNIQDEKVKAIIKLYETLKRVKNV